MNLNTNELDIAAYFQWRDEHIAQREVPRQDSSRRVADLLDEVLSFRIEAHTPLDCMMFLSNLKEKYGDGNI